MASYYNKVIGNLFPGQLAKSGDIHNIQSNIQEMISRVIIDNFGPAYILGHEEDTLKLTPTPLHIDQSNTKYDENNSWISFFERYLRQTINIEKSEINSIKVQMKNISDLKVTVFAEIRDLNFNLVKEANAELSPNRDLEYQDIVFNFNIQHLPVGSYYFVIRPIDLSRVDLIINGDETDLDTITENMFTIRYDINGNYGGLLEASYNAVDYLEARLLEDQMIYISTMSQLQNNNSDLYFEQIFSKGNTYLITPGAAVIAGQKTYPVDTHITIDGPSSLGDRTDLVILSADGKLYVVKGDIYNGKKIYPTNDGGLKIAYITTYKNSSDQWECPNCGHINEGNISNCCKCKELYNEKIPLVEQEDNNFVTRNRDILERIRRLEKKLDYDMNRNSPSRIKYNCTLDPIEQTPPTTLYEIAQTTSDQNIQTIEIKNDKEATYGLTSIKDDNGEIVYIPNNGYNVNQYYWSIKNNTTEDPIPEYIKTGNDSFYLDGINVDTEKGTISLQKNKYDEEYTKNKTLASLETYQTEEIMYTIKGDNKKGELNSEYPVLNFKLDRDTYIKSITPYITKFKNIEKFGIILFKNDEVFNLTKTSRICYQKKFKDDPTFPNVYESELKSLSNLTGTETNIKYLNNPITFDVNMEIPKGNYSLLVYGILKEGQTEGIIYITEYQTLSEISTYGMSTKCLGTSNPTLLYLETNNITDRSWDLVIEKKNATYFDRGTLISQGISTDSRIYSCSISKNYNIPDGCSIDTYVSNNGGKTWVNISKSNTVTFAGTGNTFKWKVVLNGNGEKTPEINYNSEKKYAILFNVGSSLDYVEWEDYQRCYETKCLDAEWITSFLLGNGNIKKRFSEWEFARIWMDNMNQSKIDMCFDYNEDDVFGVGTKKAEWPSKMFFSTILSSLEESDFLTSSVDYSDYEESVEPDEHNYYFNLEEETQYATKEIIICQGANDGLGNINKDNVDMKEFVYSAVEDKTEWTWEQYNQTIVTSGYQQVTYTPEKLENDDEQLKFYCSMSDEDYYNKNTIIIGKAFPNGQKLKESATGITIDIIPNLKDSSDDYDNCTRYIVPNTKRDDNPEKGKFGFPAGTFEIVLSLNENGAIEDDNATYGRAYVINQDLIAGEHNRIAIPLDIDLLNYGEIKSIGIRVVDKPLITKKYIINDDEVTYTSAETLREGDSIGIGLITIGGHNIKPFIPYGQSRLLWEPVNDKIIDEGTGAYIVWNPQIVGNNQNPWNWVASFALTVPIGIEGRPTRIGGDPQYQGGYLTGPILTDSELGTYANFDGSTRYMSYSLFNPSAMLEYVNKGLTFNEIAKKSNYIANEFRIGAEKTGNLFKIKTNMDIEKYNLIRVSYTIPDIYYQDFAMITNTSLEHKDIWYSQGSFGKGDIYLDLYDTEDIQNSLPVQSLALPAWGRTQSTSTLKNKTCNAWFKVRTTASHIKTIVLRRENPTNDTNLLPITLHINDILGYKSKNIPALGPKMLMRFYPNSNDKTSIPKIRKYGGIYTLK